MDKIQINEVPEEINSLNGKSMINGNGVSKPWTCPVCGTVNGPQNQRCVNNCVTKESVEGSDGRTLLNG
jgi:hypothetical protein